MRKSNLTKKELILHPSQDKEIILIPTKNHLYIKIFSIKESISNMINKENLYQEIYKLQINKSKIFTKINLHIVEYNISKVKLIILKAKPNHSIIKIQISLIITAYQLIFIKIYKSKGLAITIAHLHILIKIIKILIKKLII
jgi:hypothetical protein